MKIKSLILALCLSPLNSFAAPSDVKTEKESLGYVSSSIKWCGENKGKCAAGVIGTISLVVAAGVGYSYSKSSALKKPLMITFDKDYHDRTERIQEAFNKSHAYAHYPIVNSAAYQARLQMNQ